MASAAAARRVARLGKILAGHAEIFRGGAGGDGIRGRLDAFADEAHDEAGAGRDLFRVRAACNVSRRICERAIGFGMGGRELFP